MPRPASALINDVLNRVRDPNGVMHTRVFVRDRLSEAQRFLNALLGLVTASATFVQNPYQTIYSISGTLPNAQRILGVRGSSGAREVGAVPSIQQLLVFSPRWACETGSRVEAWTTVGRDLLVLYPALRHAQSLTVHYAKLTTAFPDEVTNAEFDNEYTDLIVTLTESLILLRQRDLKAAQRAMERLSKQLAPELGSERLHVAPTEQASRPRSQEATP